MDQTNERGVSYDAERKMKKRNITVYLVKMLERRSVDLLVLCVTFLKKLSIYRENKDKMLECNIIDKLARFVPGQDVLLLVTLRLLLNLSFDPTLRQQMVDRSMVGGGGKERGGASSRDTRVALT